MRCKACDAVLRDVELTKRNEYSKQYDDLCYPCLNTINIDYSIEFLDFDVIETIKSPDYWAYSLDYQNEHF